MYVVGKILRPSLDGMLGHPNVIPSRMLPSNHLHDNILDLAAAVKKVDSTIHWINQYPGISIRETNIALSTGKRLVQWVALSNVRSTGAWVTRNRVRQNFFAKETMQWQGLMLDLQICGTTCEPLQYLAVTCHWCTLPT